MNWSWNSNAHPISDVRDWQENKRLEIRPDYQRKAVWTQAAKIMLMDTILKNIPMPKIIFQSTIRDDKTYRSIIDGQQRITAILSFLKNEFPLSKPYTGPYENKFFSDLDEKVRNQFLQYKIDCNEIMYADEAVVREMYLRVNKYTIPLNKQELRRADFPGKFLSLAEELSSEDFFEESKIFTLASRRRMGDTEYISELLALIIAGIQDKKETLDDFYQNFSSWKEEDQEQVKNKLLEILNDISNIFDIKNHISKTRFKQKADFYSLVAAIKELKDDNGFIKDKCLDNLREDLALLDKYIAPESDIEILSDYAIKCVSQGNSSGSRNWRKNLLKAVLGGTYLNERPVNQIEEQFKQIIININNSEKKSPICPICKTSISEYEEEISLGWNNLNFNLSNAKLLHYKCFSNHNNGQYF